MELGNKFILIFNLLLYVVTFIIYQYRRKEFDGGSLVLLLYCLIATISIHLFFHPFSDFKNLKLLPFLFLYIALMVMFRPLLKFDKKAAEKLIEPSKIIIDTLSLVIILVAFISSINTLKNFGSVFNMYSNSDLIQSAISDERANLNEAGDGNINILGALTAIFRHLHLFLLFFYLTRDKKNKFFIIGFGYAVIFSILSSLSQGVRGQLAVMLFDIPFLYLLFNKRMSKQIRRRTKVIIGSISFIILFTFITITFSRFGALQQSVFYYVESYAGQSFLNFNNYGLDANGYRYGDKTFPLIRKSLGLEISNSYMERRMKFSHMNMNDNVFYTFVGDFTLDYGGFFAMLILLTFSYFFSRHLKIRRYSTLGQLLLAYILYSICTHGFSLYTFSELGGNRALIGLLLICTYFNLDVKIREKQQLKQLIQSKTV